MRRWAFPARTRGDEESMVPNTDHNADGVDPRAVPPAAPTTSILRPAVVVNEQPSLERRPPAMGSLAVPGTTQTSTTSPHPDAALTWRFPELPSESKEQEQGQSSRNKVPPKTGRRRVSTFWNGNKGGDDDLEGNGARSGEQSRRSSAAKSLRQTKSERDVSQALEDAPLHSDEMVDYLDVLDPAVSIFNALQDYGNSSMIPNLPWLYNRRPVLRMNQIIQPSGADSSEPMSPESIPPRDATSKERIESVPTFSLDGSESAAPSRPATGVAGTPETPIIDTYAEALRRQQGKNKELPEEIEALEHTQLMDTAGEEKEHTERWYEMDEAERKEVEAHIRYLLTGRSKTKRMIKGFWNFVRTPMGFILTTYIFLLFSWGLVIFLFIVNWVEFPTSYRRRLWIEVCDQVLCALFVLRGIGFAPFRVIDTYRMAHIAHFHFLTYRRRKLLQLPELSNKSELPRYTDEQLQMARSHHHHQQSTEPADQRKDTDPQSPTEKRNNSELDKAPELPQLLLNIGVKKADEPFADIPHVVNLLRPIPGYPTALDIPDEEAERRARLERRPSIESAVEKEAKEISVLTPGEQAALQHQQRLFHASHTYCRYVETETHRPFPLWLMMTIVLLLDVYSMLQVCLAGTMWGIRYERRPTVLTATIVSTSLSCNAIAGLLIWLGSIHTRKTEVVKHKVQLALEEMAIRRMERKWRKEATRQREESANVTRATSQPHSSTTAPRVEVSPA